MLFSGAKLGMAVDPFNLMRIAWTKLTGLKTEVEQSSMLGLAGLYLLCWALAWSGVLGLLSRRRLLLSPGVLLLAGIGAGGLGAALTFGHPGLSQLFFLMGALPYLAILAVYGLMVVVRHARLSRGTVVAAAGCGVLAAFLLPLLCGVAIPLPPGTDPSVLYWPYFVLTAVAVPAGIVLMLRMGVLRAGAVMIVVFTALSLPGNVRDRLVYQEVRIKSTLAVPQGALDVMRWVRANSRPDDLVATNMHCKWGSQDRCEISRFWVAAFGERRVLLEGWAYTPKNLRNWKPGIRSSSSSGTGSVSPPTGTPSTRRRRPPWGGCGTVTG
nr:hypothetical protein GCM10020093_089480 [Planobispora longispora]